MTSRCERRHQIEIGIIEHEGRIFAALGSSVIGHNVTAYTSIQKGRVFLTTWCGKVMLACRSETVREYRDGSIALVFRLTNGRCIVGYALGDDGMLFRGELIAESDEDGARREALQLAAHWSEVDAQDNDEAL
jgi:hypothetical protein